MDLSAPALAEAEVSDAVEVIERKAHTLAGQIRKSKHFIVFTGAGVSTSAGIPDFRGPEGAWTLRAQGRERLAKDKAVSTLQAVPTKTHMALVELQNRGMLKYLISQNCDGLHRRSGILPDKISELHGNSNLEHCRSCGKEYLRDFRAAVPPDQTSLVGHRTGRNCAICGGILLDSIINFGESLPVVALERAFEEGKKADLCLVLGSSLMVGPANEVPEVTVTGKRKCEGEVKGKVGKGRGKLAICNLQSTILDGMADTEISMRAKTDDLMVRLMEKLGIDIPEFVLRRRMVVELECREGRHELKIRGIDVDGTPVSFLQSVRLKQTRRAARTEPFVIRFRREIQEAEINLELEFMGHYGEPNLVLDVGSDFAREQGGIKVYLLEYNPRTEEWRVEKENVVAVNDSISN